LKAWAYVGSLRDPRKRQELRTRLEPETVGRFIRIANDVPEAELDPDFPGMPRNPLFEAFMKTQLESADEWPTAGVSIIRKIVRDWGEHARAYVLEGKTYGEMDWRYNLARTFRDLLSAIASQNPMSPFKTASDRIYKLPHSATLLSTLSLRMVRTTDSRPAATKRLKCAVIEPPEHLREFLEHVELERIKRCAYEKCSKIFWAGRIDTPCCSEPCRNAYRQKKHRDKKRENRPYKKRLLRKGTLRNE
jgi:hypothetical protein